MMVHRFMDARTLMNLVAGNWASFETELESDEPFESDGLLAVDIPWVRFSTDERAARARAGCRGGIVRLELDSLVEGDEYRREGDDVYITADVLVGEPVHIELSP